MTDAKGKFVGLGLFCENSEGNFFIVRGNIETLNNYCCSIRSSEALLKLMFLFLFYQLAARDCKEEWYIQNQ